MDRNRTVPALVAGTLFLILAAVAAAQPPTVSYQGELSSGGAPFTGNAGFKFAILCGTASAWSNDGTSSNGSEPAGAVSLTVSGGQFSVLLGDAGAGMVPLAAPLVSSCANPRLRVWVDTGSGFEQLTDQPLASAPFALKSALADGARGTFVIEDGTVKVANGSGTTTITLLGETGQVSVGSIRFADNTVQTTAGGGAADGDWVINGANMSSGVAGNVGIGTASPDRKLHVTGGSDIDNLFNGGYLRIGPTTTGNLLIDNNEIQAVNNGAANGLGINVEGGNVGVGTVNAASKLHVIGDARVDGANGLGIDTRNPNATTAIARFGWLNDVARLRIGGSGLGSNNGLDIQGTSDASLLRLLDNGNVGVGTTTPTARLEVAGNAVIQGNLTVQGAITGGGGGTQILAIPPSAFLEEETNQMDVHRSSVLLHGRTAGQGLTFEAPVYLPHGATITGFTVFLTDSDATRNIQTFLLRDPLGNAGAGQIVATLASTGSPGAVTLSSGALGHIVDNQNNSYVVACNWTTPTTVTNCAVTGMRITYTLP